jgi:Ca-activated chloride channel family protein
LLPPAEEIALMNLESAACLKTLSGENVPLQGVSVRGRLQGLLLELTVEQRYRNDGARPIESVYTFPLSVSAVLLGFELDLNGRRYEAEAVARQAAEKRYEQAVDRGDSAALLTQNDEGLYTANLANLMPGETATIRYRYAEYLPVHCAVARLRIPTAITPRYGNPAAGGLQGPSVPRHDLVVDYPFDLEIELPQVGQANRLHSPSHSLDLAAGERGLIVRLNGKGALDRDFVLQVQGIEALNEVLVARDGLEQVAMVTATLPLRDRVPEPLALKLLVDCSGSMQGNSIVAAREALQAGLGQLDPEDRLSLSLFGSTLQHVTDGLESADDRTLAPLRALIGRVQADMGGTEMESAMKQVLAIPVPA